ncbi:MAG: DUF5906 domain-containing protein [Eubacterium sp.]|nr:DUF5906 domain-containing protein [Eubacterium sp.]
MKEHNLKSSETALKEIVNKESVTYNFITSNIGQENIPHKFLSFLRYFSKDDIVTVVKTLAGINMLLRPGAADSKFAVAISTKSKNLKSLILTLLETELGSEACCELKTDCLTTPFGLSEIKGKQLAIISDTAHGIISSEIISAFTTEKYITVEVKYGNPCHIKNKAKLLIFTNTNNPLTIIGNNYNVCKAYSRVLTCHFTEGDNYVLSTSEIYNIIKDERENIIALSHIMSKIFERACISVEAAREVI